MPGPVSDKVTTTGTARPDWMIAAELALALDVAGPIADATGVDDLTAAIAAHVDGFQNVTPAALAADPNGVLVDVVPSTLGDTRHVATQRNNYDHRLVVGRKLYDRGIGTAMSHSIAKLAPGAGAHLHPLDVEALGATDGGDVKLIGAKSTVILPVVADPRIARGVVWAPFNQGGGTVEDLIDASAPITDLKIEVI